MDRFDRIFTLHRLLSGSRLPVSRQRIEEELECSRATAKRIIEAMRLYLNAPIKYDRERNGYHYHSEEGEMYELPGIWFNSTELLALLTLQQLLSQLQPGLLEQQLLPLGRRIDALLLAQGTEGRGINDRIRILSMAARPAGDHFQTVTSALAKREQLQILYYSRSKGSSGSRILSPQRLVHYRDNWYLDAYCHERNALRTFALDAIAEASRRPAGAREIPQAELDRHYASAYGIFGGPASKTAILKFLPDPARWVSHEKWHPEQRQRWLSDGRLELQIPYHKSTELVMDILKYGPDVEVAGPPELRQEIEHRLLAAARIYAGK